MLLVLFAGAGVTWYVMAGGLAAGLMKETVAAGKEAAFETTVATKPAPPAAAEETPPATTPSAATAKPAITEPITVAKPSPAPPTPPPAPATPPVKVEPIVQQRPPPQLAPPEAAPAKKQMVAHALSKEEQPKVDAAIERGVRFLKAQQGRNGTWRQDGFHAIGYAALPALTLLECGVPAKDPVIRRAASVVRGNVQRLNDTYDLALALLFLDRLGERSDRDLIQYIALRLVAGQTEVGGWNYECPLLTRAEMSKLMLFLKQTRPEAAQLLSLPAATGPAKTGPADKTLPRSSSTPGESKSPPLSSKPTTMPKQQTPAKAKPVRPESLPPNVRRLPIVNAIAQLPGGPQGKGMQVGFFASRDDNSNSQFALLALWAARRHDVPTERTLALADKRYRSHQNADGGWGYQLRSPTTSAMTGVGLLGLAVGHGASEEGLRAAAEGRQNKNVARKLLRDRAIQDGLQAFSQYIGGADDTAPLHSNLYFLWTVERVAMLYSLPTIGNKDWYRWGVHILLPRQQPAGGWLLGGYPGADMPVDTSFALLFLKRSNLVQDLTRDLTFYLAISDPGGSSKRK
jgi:hypothetical protein